MFPNRRYLLGLVAFAYIVSLSVCGQERRTPYCLTVSETDHGWFAIYFDVKGAPPLALSDGCLQVDFRSQRTISTSTNQPTGWGMDRLFEVVNGHRREISWDADARCVQDSFTSSFQKTGSPKESSEWFFIGTLDEFRTEPRPER